MMVWFLSALAGAQEPAEEITVYGSAEVEAARAAVVARLEELGFSRVTVRDGRLVMKHESTWKGKIVLHNDGYLQHLRQGVRVEKGPAVALPRGTRWLPCLLIPTGCFSAGFAVSDRRFRGLRDRTMTQITPQLTALGDRMADASVRDTMNALPPRLAALWSDGTPLGGGPALNTYRARRAELVRFWSTRTNTPWGNQVREVVEAFARGVVQHSDHPFTPAELALDAITGP